MNPICPACLGCGEAPHPYLKDIFTACAHCIDRESEADERDQERVYERAEKVS